MNATRHKALALAAGALFTGAGMAAAGAGAAPGAVHGSVGHRHVVRTAGGEVFQANRSDTFTLRFAQPDITVHSGDTVAFVHGDRTPDPHSVSVVAVAELPHRSDPCAVCNRFETAQFPQGQNGPPKPVVDVGRPGLDQPGDSVVWMSGRTAVKVSAAAGSTLHYFCIFHPWMQGTIHVVK